jgi:hypothetical protein
LVKTLVSLRPLDFNLLLDGILAVEPKLKSKTKV